MTTPLYGRDGETIGELLGHGADGVPEYLIYADQDFDRHGEDWGPCDPSDDDGDDEGWIGLDELLDAVSDPAIDDAEFADMMIRDCAENVA